MLGKRLQRDDTEEPASPTKKPKQEQQPLLENVLVYCLCCSWDQCHDSCHESCPIQGKDKEKTAEILAAARETELILAADDASRCTLGNIVRVDSEARNEGKSNWHSFWLSIPELSSTPFEFEQGEGEVTNHKELIDGEFSHIKVRGHRLTFMVDFKHQWPVLNELVIQGHQASLKMVK